VFLAATGKTLGVSLEAQAGNQHPTPDIIDPSSAAASRCSMPARASAELAAQIRPAASGLDSLNLAWGEYPIALARFYRLDYRAMKGRELLQAGKPAGAAVQGPTHSSHRILMVDGGICIRQFSAEGLIHSGRLWR
jgi:hypothetical protein